MTIGLVGEKVGMTRVFTDDGRSTPVTVIKVDPNRVTQIKNTETDGYSAIQVTNGKRKQSKVNKPTAGHYAKAGVEAGKGLHEFRVNPEELSVKLGDAEPLALEVGSEITVELFSEGQMVDVVGTSKGKGFAGVIKRHNFSMQDATHGNSLAHRAPGSIGQNQTPGRVFKGKKMAGHMGDQRTTIQNLEVVRVDSDRNLILIKGSIPGAKTGKVIVKPAVKAKAEEK